jgi:predicted DNA-binding transcriptional regulator YafY
MNTLRAKQVQYAHKKRHSMMTADQIKELIWIWVSTKTTAELARHFGCSKKTIQRIAWDIRELGLIFIDETVYYRPTASHQGIWSKEASNEG